MNNVRNEQQHSPSVSSEGLGEQNHGEKSLHCHTERVPEYGNREGVDSRQSLENHRKLDEIRRFHNKKFEEGHDVHRNLALAEGYARPNKKGEYQYVSGVMGIAYNLLMIPASARGFLNSEAASACRNHEVAELLQFWTEKIIVIDPTEREKPSLGLLLEATPKVISVARSSKRVELSLGDENRSNFERQNAIGKPMGNVTMPEKDDVVHEKMMELEPLLEASGERNLRSIEITHGECPGHCLAQTVWYPVNTNLCLV